MSAAVGTDLPVSGRRTPARSDNGEPLGDRMRRMATFADQVPQHARVQVAVALDSLATLLGRVVADTEDELTR